MGVIQNFLVNTFGEKAEPVVEPAAVDDASIASTQEATFRSGAGVDPDENLWQPVFSPGGLARRRSLPSIDQQRMIRIAHHLYRANPLAKRTIEITAQYAIGDGLRFSADSPKIMEVLAEHWTDTTNNWPLSEYEIARDLGLLGEQCIPASVNKSDGHVTLGNIDTALIDYVVADKENPMKVHAIILRKLPRENYRRAYKVIDVANVSAKSELFGRMVGLPEDEKEKEEFGFPFMKGEVVEAKLAPPNVKAKWEGSCFYFKVNSPRSADRGWSDLLSDFDWLDAHDQFLFSQVEKAIESANYVWDITLNGMNEVQIMEFLSKRAKHKPGTRVAHNENVVYQVLSPDLHLEDATALATALKNNIIAGVGHPPIWYAESMTARASAPEQTEPAYKNIKIRQRYIAFMISRIFQYQIDSSIHRGAITPDKRLRTENQRVNTRFTIMLPEVSAKDNRADAIALNNLTSALNNAIGTEIITKDDAKRVLQRYIDRLAIDTWTDEPGRGQALGPHEEDDNINDALKRVPSQESYVEGATRHYVFNNTRENLALTYEAEQMSKESKESKSGNNGVIVADAIHIES